MSRESGKRNGCEHGRRVEICAYENSASQNEEEKQRRTRARRKQKEEEEEEEEEEKEDNTARPLQL